MDQDFLPTPYYIVYEDRLRRNLELIRSVAERAGVKIIMAFKANALWKTFPIIREYTVGSTASSINEMQLAADFFGGEIHSYCPVYTPETFPEFLRHSSHITFNSLAQYHRYADQIRQAPRKVSPGLRVNPHCSVIETDIYNPCRPGSRFGMSASQIGSELPEGLEGFHFHALCESSSYDLEKVLESFEKEYGAYLPHLKWVNMGGGHLMTRKDYDTDHLVSLLRAFKERYPNLEVILEPGSAFTWQTGDLVTTVLDVVEDSGIRTGIIDASFACHMPDCLEMPYKPAIEEALPEESSQGIPYRLGGNSCLSGDFVGDWRFAEPLKEGQRLTLKDMNHYTTVKTNMFNGISHPSIYLRKNSGETELLRRFTYEDYRDRMD